MRLWLLLGCIAGLMQMSLPASQSLTLAWNASSGTNILGYRIYYGTASHRYDSEVSVGNVTSATIAGLVEGTVYFFSVTAYDSSNVESDFADEAAIAIPLNLPNRPVKPSCGTAASGQNVTISLTATNIGTCAYQWKFNGNNIVSATNAVLILNNLSASQAGEYSVTVSDDTGSSDSTKARLMIYSTTAATLTQPAYADGQFTCNVSGVPGSQYAIQASTDRLNWAPIQTNTAPFTFTDLDAGQFNQRFYRAMNYSGAGDSAPAGLKVFLVEAAVLSQQSYASGQYSFNVSGVSGNQYVVQASTNLVDWVSVETNTAPFTFVDSEAGEYSQRFYRTCWVESP